MRVEPWEGVGDIGHDLVLAHDADVQVGQQGDDASSLAGAVVEHHGSGLGDAHGDGGNDGVDGVEPGVGQPVVDKSGTVGVQCQPGRYDDGSRAVQADVMAPARSAGAQRVTVAR